MASFAKFYAHHVPVLCTGNLSRAASQFSGGLRPRESKEGTWSLRACLAMG
jgi:uncharacterized membrane protein YoaK (UPF0700 family)